jgi:hypothetical protein
MRRVLVFVLALALAASPAGAAQAPKVHRFKLTVDQVTLSSTGNPPASGTEVALGKVSGTYAGAEVAHIQFPTPGTFTASAVTYSATGSVRSTQKGSGTLNQDGSISGSGTGVILGGTGTFKNARGKFTFTFYGAKFGGPVTFKLMGQMKY